MLKSHILDLKKVLLDNKSKLWCISFFHLGSTGGSVSKQSPAKQETQVQSPVQEDPLEKEMATHSPTPVFLPGKSHELRSLMALVHGVMKSRTQLSD